MRLNLFMISCVRLGPGYLLVYRFSLLNEKCKLCTNVHKKLNNLTVILKILSCHLTNYLAFQCTFLFPNNQGT